MLGNMKSQKNIQRSPYWFRAKTYGWGWTPASWQGWMILLIYMYALVTMFLSVDARSRSGSDTLISLAVPFILATTIMIAICYRTGEPPEWRWGQFTSKTKKRKTVHAKH